MYLHSHFLRNRYRIVVVAFVWAAVTGSWAKFAAAQDCTPQWWDDFFASDLSGPVHAFAEFDEDGPGPAEKSLFVGGDFVAAGGLVVNHVARFVPATSEWSALDEGVNGVVRALAVFDDGSGEALYAAGGFTTAGGATAERVAKWDGTAWTPVGGGLQGAMFGHAYALAVFDPDGPGALAPRLFAGGLFNAAEGNPAAAFLAQWNGTAWSRVGMGVNGAVFSFAALEQDAGPLPRSLYIGGSFTTAGGAATSRVARWDGAAWTTFATGPNDSVNALAVHDEDGDGPATPALFAGGIFFNAAGLAETVGIARWDGSVWSSVGGGVGGAVSALTTFDEDGGGPNPPRLFAGGNFTTAGGAMIRRVARWDGALWSGLDDGVDAPLFATITVSALAPVPDATGGPALYIGGDFASVSGTTANRVARWQADQWSALSRQPHGLSGIVKAVSPFEDAAGRAIIAGGEFIRADNVTVNRIARLGFSATGAPTGWTPLEGGMTAGVGIDFGVLALEVFDEDGDGPNSPRLFPGGSFTVVDGQPIGFIARWDPDTSEWSAVGLGVNAAVHALEVYDPDGPGPAPPRLVAAGTFSMAGGMAVNNIAQWDGTAWSALSTGVNGVVNAMAEYDHDGPGPATPKLVVGGTFTSVGPVQMSRIAQWDGAVWSPLGLGMNHHVHALTVHDPDAAGAAAPLLIAGGQFGVAGGVVVNGIAQWNGFSWAALGTGMNNVVRAVVSIDEDGPGPSAPVLMAGGFFTIAGGGSASRIARWNGTSWSPLGLGVNDVVFALATQDTDGAGELPPTLLAGGFFEQAGGLSSSFFAAHGCLRPAPAPGDIDGDGDVDFVDVDVFVDVLLGVDNDPAHVAASDLNGDDIADGGDIQMFASAILAG